MENINPFKVFWINALKNLSPDMAIYILIVLLAVFLIAVKERIVFLIAADLFFLIVFTGLILYKWGF